MARDPCPVCRGRMRSRVCTPCKHQFCKRCLCNVYRMCPSNTCPMCRDPFEYYVRKINNGIRIVFFI
ncbi:tripartite motif-containing protein 65-like [Drosophila serrata]|uniref:tripartite motif-containing protein 65-like n=1 Tax=Drosophila serrata TaxID=7274 RepID=UPI000A1D2763|nr:tripartite motif-containing protein 65-like [Drosophila serrata]